MKNTLILAQKDLASYFRSWVGTFLAAFFLLISGIFFAVLVISYAKISLDAQRTAFEGVQGLGLTRFIYSSFFLNLGAVMMFLVPMLTMRAIAEERRHDTLELLYTYPLSDAQIVMGKFLALSAFFIMLLLPTLIYTAVLKFWLFGFLAAGECLFGAWAFCVLAFGQSGLKRHHHVRMSHGILDHGLGGGCDGRDGSANPVCDFPAQPLP
jgi:ABC-2 type transport system permease protein